MDSINQWVCVCGYVGPSFNNDDMGQMHFLEHINLNTQVEHRECTWTEYYDKKTIKELQSETDELKIEHLRLREEIVRLKQKLSILKKQVAN